MSLPLLLFVGYLALTLTTTVIPGLRRTRLRAEHPALPPRREAGPLLLAVSLFAVAIDGRFLLGGLAEGGRTGFTNVHLLIALLLVVPALLLHAPRIRVLGELYGNVTIGDFLGQRFQHGSLRSLTAGLMVAALCLQITGHLVAVGYLAEGVSASAIPPRAAIVIVSVVVACATSQGSLQGLMRGHLVQGTVIAAGAAALLGFALTTLPGPGAGAAPAETLQPGRLDPPSWSAASAWLGSALLTALSFSAQPQVLQHVFAARSDLALRRGLGGFSLIALAVVPVILAASVWIGPHIFTPPDVPTALIAWPPPGIPGTLPPDTPLAPLLAFVLLAGIVSTLDAAVLALAQVVCRECAAPLLRRDRQELSRPRHLAIATWATILPATAVAARWSPQPMPMLEIAAALFLQLLPCLWLGPYNRRLRGGPALAGMALGSVITLTFLIAGQPLVLGLPAGLLGLTLNLALCWTGIATLGYGSGRRPSARS